MNGTLLELRDKAVNQNTIEKLRMAVAIVAKNVYADPNETAQHKEYAVTVAKNPLSIAKQMSEMVIILAVDDSDAELIVATKTVFDVYASTVEVTV